MKDNVYVPPFPTTLAELQNCITAALANIDRDMLEHVWADLDYRIDVCRVTRGEHICNDVQET